MGTEQLPAPMAYPLEQGRIHQLPLAVLALAGRYVQGPRATHELGRELKRMGAC